MDLYEYQGKRYLAEYGVPTSEGMTADNVEEALKAAQSIGYPVAIKAQVQVGGRGKAGGIKLAANPEEAATCAASILGLDIKGHLVRRLWIEKTCEIAKEYYASFALDRVAKRYVCMLSAQGGVEIEQVAEEHPDAIARLEINPLDGISAEEATSLCVAAGIDEAARAGVAEVLLSLYRCYVEGDADLVEVNPLVLRTDGGVQALDAKVTLDDAAAFRHPEWEEFRGLSDADHRELLAKEKGLQYVGLDGYVGIIANGAGLAMSTCDVVAQVGGEPANFLDIGGGADANHMADALEVITTDEKVRSILINIFGGITRGEEVANGIVQALQRVEITTPIVIRIDGTNAEEGRAILASHLSDRIVTRPTMLEAAREAVRMAGGPA